jgi:2-methylisocitrate lyase-like PEP mutase family enzyme
MVSTTELFRRMHDGTHLLILANCWDAGSARLIASLGARAIATSSAAMAWAHAYPDGDVLPRQLLIDSIRAINRVIAVPLSVDIEGGYAEEPGKVAELVHALLDAGAVGINIEDGALPAEQLASKIERIKQMAARFGADIFVNARTDVYLRGLVPEPERLKETLKRAKLYEDAGADGLFVPRVLAPAEIRQLADAGLPLNVLASPGLPAAAELATLGVRRLSAGSGIAQATWGRAATLARAFLQDGRSEPLAEGAMIYPEINALFAPR